MTLSSPLFGGGPGGSSAVPNWVHNVVTVAGSSAAAVGMMLSIAPVTASAMRTLFMLPPVSSAIASDSTAQAIQQVKRSPLVERGALGEPGRWSLSTPTGAPSDQE